MYVNTMVKLRSLDNFLPSVRDHAIRILFEDGFASNGCAIVVFYMSMSDQNLSCY